jgi:hypothetical protein
MCRASRVQVGDAQSLQALDRSTHGHLARRARAQAGHRCPRLTLTMRHGASPRWSRPPHCSSTRGFFATLCYQTGCFGAPPSEATTAYSPLCSTRISGVLRSLPVSAPTLVSRMIGLPFMSAASAPPDSACLSACSRDQSLGLGADSPVSGIATTLRPRSNPAVLLPLVMLWLNK